MCAGGPRGILDISPQFPNTHVKILQISTFVKVLQSFSRKPERFLFGPGRAETSRRDPAGDARVLEVGSEGGAVPWLPVYW